MQNLWSSSGVLCVVVIGAFKLHEVQVWMNNYESVQNKYGAALLTTAGCWDCQENEDQHFNSWHWFTKFEFVVQLDRTPETLANKRGDSSDNCFVHYLNNTLKGIANLCVFYCLWLFRVLVIRFWVYQRLVFGQVSFVGLTGKILESKTLSDCNSDWLPSFPARRLFSDLQWFNITPGCSDVQMDCTQRHHWCAYRCSKAHFSFPEEK